MHPVIEEVAHRPWPLPSGPWILAQTWEDLLFAHWPIAPDVLRPLVPPQLPLDTFDNHCWVAVAPFRMSHVHLRGLPPLPGLSRFPELNVRTYVAVRDKPGVYFFSLDAANVPAVLAARRFYHLPYFHAGMSVDNDGTWVHYYSRRKKAQAEFQGRYRPTADVVLREKGTLAHWLTERYCLYTVSDGHIHRAEIHHRQWPLQDAAADIAVNTIAGASGIPLPPAAPLLHFAKKLEVLTWPLRKISI